MRYLAGICLLLALSTWPVLGDDKPGAEKKPADKSVDKPAAEKPSAEELKKRDQVNRDKDEAARKEKEAAAKKEKEAGQAKVDKGGMFKLFEFPKGIQENLSEEQKSQLADLQKQFGPRLETAFTAVQTILTPEIRKAQAQAAAAAAEKFLDEKLSDKEKTELKKAQEELQSLQQELRDKMLAVVPQEQLAKLKGAAPEKNPDAAGQKKLEQKKDGKPGQKGAPEGQSKKTDGESKKLEASEKQKTAKPDEQPKKP